MKIGISSTGNSVDSLMDTRFGRCSFFIVHDTETKRDEFVDNASKAASGGAGTSAAQEMINRNVDAVITGNMGPNAYRVFENAGIKVYRCANVHVKTAIKMFNESQLEIIDAAGPAHAGMAKRGGV